MIADILDLVQKQEQWHEKQCINLIPSENMMSPQACMHIATSELSLLPYVIITKAILFGHSKDDSEPQTHQQSKRKNTIALSVTRQSA